MSPHEALGINDAFRRHCRSYAPPGERRRMTVEQALSWGYREEELKIRDEGVHRVPALPAVLPHGRRSLSAA